MSGGRDRGARAADALTKAVGSWTFVVAQAALLSAWFILNTVAWFTHWDEYPFVLANLFMSAEAAFTGPVILMSSNRSDAEDRAVLRQDLEEDSETNRLVRAIADRLGIEGNEV